jgi:hypothetical protein
MASVSRLSNIRNTAPQTRLADEIIELQRPIAIAHKVSFGDFIQFAGAVGITNCPGAPSLEFLAGRFNFSIAAPDGLLPEPADSVDKIIARFADAGFSANEIVDLLVSHTVAAQDDVDPTIHVSAWKIMFWAGRTHCDCFQGSPLDSTPGQFDSQFFIEVCSFKLYITLQTINVDILYRRYSPEPGSPAKEATSERFPLPSAGNSVSSPTLPSLVIPGASFIPDLFVACRSHGDYGTSCRTACEWQSFVSQYSVHRSPSSGSHPKQIQPITRP